MATVAHRPNTSRLLAGAAFSGANLAALATVSSVAVLSAHLWLLIAGVWLYALLIARDVQSPRYWRRLAAADEATRRQLPYASELQEEALRTLVHSLRNGYREIARELKGLPANAQVRAAASLEELRVQAAKLIREADELHRHLRAVPREVYERDIKRLSEARVTAEGAARAEYDRALSVREEHLAARERIRDEHDRMIASLQLVLAVVETFPSRVFCLRMLDERAGEDLLAEIHEQVARIDEDISCAQRLVETLEAAGIGGGNAKVLVARSELQLGDAPH